MLSAICVLVVLSFGVVCTHEFGHWFLAQLCALRTEEFSIGFGTPRIYLGRFRQTNFYISLWLIGGYVKIPELYSGISGAFTGLRPPPIWKRLLVTCGGVFMNVVTAVTIVFLLEVTLGVPKATVPSIDRLVPGFPAASAGLLPGDLVQSVNGLQVNTTTEAAQAIFKHPNEPVQLTVQRKGSDLQIMVTPNAQGKIGVMFNSIMEHVSVPTAAYNSLAWTGNVLVNILSALLKLLDKLLEAVGIFSPNPNSSTPSFHGPVGVFEGASQALQFGWVNLAWFIAYLNLGLAVGNILPLPVLDGGHVVLLVLEKIRGKQLSRDAQVTWTSVGAALLLGIMAISTWHDIVH